MMAHLSHLRGRNIYQNLSNDDLQEFFDRYLYGKDNDWESTAKVRHSLLGFNRECIVNRPEQVYPPSYVEHHIFFLNSQTATMMKALFLVSLFQLATYPSPEMMMACTSFIHSADIPS